MSTHPYIPLYVDDFEGATAHLTPAEDGIYNRLLRLCWRTPGCSIPDDDAWIARKIRVSPTDYDTLARPVIEEYFTRSRGRVFQKRLRDEYDAISVKKDARKNAGKSGGIAKARKTKEKTASNASVLPPDTRAFPEPYPEPYPEPDKEPPIAPTGAEAGSLFGDQDLPIEKPDDVRVAFDLWVEMATRTGLPVPELLTDERRRKIKARLKDGGLDAWRRAIKAVEGSAFCRGQTPARDGHKPFRADLTFITQAQSYSRLLEGFYGQDAKPASGSSREAPATTFTGPDEVRQAIMNRVHDRAFLDKWLNPAMWDGQNRVIIARTNHAADQLRQYVEGDLIKIGVTITGPRPNVVPFAREARSA